MTAQNFLHLWDSSFLYVTPAIESDLTARSSVTLLASVSGHPFRLEAADGTRALCTAAVVAAGTQRRLYVDGCGLLSLNLDPGSSAYRTLSQWMNGHGIVPIDAQCFGRLRDSFEAAQCGALAEHHLQSLSTRMVEAVTERPESEGGLDPRIDSVMRVARSHAGPLPLQDLSEVACLSPDRLTHLFREQTGVSIKNYLLWAKVRRSVQQFASGRPLADIALDGGFASAAHMSRTFQCSFGLPPSFLSRQVRVTADDEAERVWGL
ncbi:helix-turn-helix domain-containing protein [Variovorax sp. ZS18.2.2]|uniref:helix-turn-helix domain-containing protein n=1 Tax=Variovorax sp. ZS18.2.2 TaxID=2971255 RepID=UPI002151FB13|nr:helix-turn-helix domain-containing protein [Variovorax sp. ZS18.2.2]MCR6474676.1 helix-turn-helix domain-containing protein [Variovorax sp. ZS18.2.2]